MRTNCASIRPPFLKLKVPESDSIFPSCSKFHVRGTVRGGASWDSKGIVKPKARIPIALFIWSSLRVRKIIPQSDQAIKNEVVLGWLQFRPAFAARHALTT